MSDDLKFFTSGLSKHAPDAPTSASNAVRVALAADPTAYAETSTSSLGEAFLSTSIAAVYGLRTGIYIYLHYFPFTV